MYDLLRKNERKTPAHRQLAKHFTNQTPNLPSPADYTRALFIVEGPPFLNLQALRHIHPSKMQASLPPPPNTFNTEIEFWDRFGFLWRLSTSPHNKKNAPLPLHTLLQSERVSGESAVAPTHGHRSGRIRSRRVSSTNGFCRLRHRNRRPSTAS